jgi:hypothetical protein
VEEKMNPDQRLFDDTVVAKRNADGSRTIVWPDGISLTLTGGGLDEIDRASAQEREASTLRN